VLNPEEVFFDAIKARDNSKQHIYTNVANFYKIPSPILKQDYKFSVVKEMYIDLLYHNKKQKESMEK